MFCCCRVWERGGKCTVYVVEFILFYDVELVLFYATFGI